MKDGKWVEQPSTFFDAEQFGKAASENSSMKKGSEVFVAGKLHSQQWKTQDGQNLSKVLISAYTVRELVSVRREPIEQATEVSVEQPSSGEDIPF